MGDVTDLSGFDLSLNFTEFLKSLPDLKKLESGAGLFCGPNSECYKKKNSEKLQSIYDDAKDSLVNAPLEVSLAEKNLYLYNNGVDGGEYIYKNLIIDRFAKTAQELRTNSIQKQQDFMMDLSRVLKQYRIDVLSFEKTKKLLQTREEEKQKIIKNINMYDRIIKTNERKVVYEDKDADGLNIYRRVMLFIYYSVIISYIIFGNFIPDKLYLKYTLWIVIIIVSIIPIIMNMIIKWFFIIGEVVLYWFKDMPHKDVYIDL